MLSPDTVLQHRYRVIRRIGQGGMGAVYETRHEELGQKVALKEAFHTEDEGLRKAFKREARMLASLRHPMLPHVIDYFNEGDGLYLVMDYISGDDLGELLRKRGSPFPLAEVTSWALQLLDVLEYLHSQTPPIVHRDVKPSNIKLTTEGEVILLDFGLAKGAVSDMTSVIASRSVLGFTLTYAPLEQILKADPNLIEHLAILEAEKVERLLSSETNARSDLYALGGTLYHLLTNKLPPQSLTRALSLWSGRPDPLFPANEINPQVPPALVHVLARAMALESIDRPASAAEMRDMLLAAVAVESDPVLATTQVMPLPATIAPPQPIVAPPQTQPTQIPLSAPQRQDSQAPPSGRTIIRVPIRPETETVPWTPPVTSQPSQKAAATSLLTSWEHPAALNTTSSSRSRLLPIMLAVAITSAVVIILMSVLFAVNRQPGTASLPSQANANATPQLNANAPVADAQPTPEKREANTNSNENKQPAAAQATPTRPVVVMAQSPRKPEASEPIGRRTFATLVPALTLPQHRHPPSVKPAPKKLAGPEIAQ